MLGTAGKRNEGGKMKLLPFTIAASFIQLHNWSRGGQMLRTPERKTEEGGKLMKAVRKTDKGSFLNVQEDRRHKTSRLATVT